jgi:hypothetical protein
MAILSDDRRGREINVCPVCGATGAELCAEEDGQYVLDHWGRPGIWLSTPDETATRVAAGTPPRRWAS